MSTCRKTSLQPSIFSLEIHLLSNVLAPRAVQDELSLKHEHIQLYLCKKNISFPATPPLRHFKTLLESKLGENWTFYLRILSSSPKLS